MCVETRDRPTPRVGVSTRWHAPSPSPTPPMRCVRRAPPERPSEPRGSPRLTLIFVLLLPWPCSRQILHGAPAAPTQKDCQEADAQVQPPPVG